MLFTGINYYNTFIPTRLLYPLFVRRRKYIYNSRFKIFRKGIREILNFRICPNQRVETSDTRSSTSLVSSSQIRRLKERSPIFLPISDHRPTNNPILFPLWSEGKPR